MFEYQEERSLKKRIYEIIEVSRPNDKASKAYDIFMMVTIMVSLLPMTSKTMTPAYTVIDYVTLVIFIVDYFLRMFTSDYKMGILSYKAYLAYPFTPMAIIDLLSILPAISFFTAGWKYMNMFRLLRTLRVFKLVRYSKTMTIITNVFRKQKKYLGAVVILAVAYIIISGMIVFQVEPDTFDSFFDAMYWATISLVTTGYGDIYPVSVIGRCVTMISSLVGVAIVALPAGIVTAGYMEEMSKLKDE